MVFLQQVSLLSLLRAGVCAGQFGVLEAQSTDSFKVGTCLAIGPPTYHEPLPSLAFERPAKSPLHKQTPVHLPLCLPQVGP